MGDVGAAGWWFGCSAAAVGGVCGGATWNAGSPELTDGERVEGEEEEEEDVERVSKYLTLSGP